MSKWPPSFRSRACCTQASGALYPAVSQVTPHFTKPARSHRAEVFESARRGYDIGPDPPYLQSATSEPRQEVISSTMWHENRGKLGKQIMVPGGDGWHRGGGRSDRQGVQPGEEPAAGLTSGVIQASRSTRTGLKLKKDCWGNYLPH